VNATTYGIRAIDGVPTNPLHLSEDPRFPDLNLYRILLDHLGKVDADRLWHDAKIAGGAA
jgi:hypothetical protein